MGETFSELFKKAWAHPDPDGLVSLLHENVVLYQPHRPVIRGKHAAHREFTQLLSTFSALYGEVDRWLDDGKLAFIEWRLIIAAGKKTISIPMVDRFFIVDGLGLERKVFFDQWQMARSVLATPALLPGFLKYLYF